MTSTISCRCGYPLPEQGNGSHSCAHYYEQRVTAMQEEIAALRAIARSAAQEEETKLDENQFITQQSRIVKLAALREAGYLKEEG